MILTNSFSCSVLSPQTSPNICSTVQFRGHFTDTLKGLHTVPLMAKKSVWHQLLREVMKWMSGARWSERTRRGWLLRKGTVLHMEDINKHSSYFSVFKTDWHAVQSGLKVSVPLSWTSADKASGFLTLFYSIIMFPSVIWDTSAQSHSISELPFNSWS